jgi:hypothetical protein
MASGFGVRARIARRLSRTGPNELLISQLPELADYAKKIIAFKESAAIDKRAVAIGTDIENHWYDAIVEVSDDFAHILWQNVAQIKMWYDLLLSDGTSENPKKVLTCMQLPCDFMLDMMSDPTKSFTFLNNIDLYYFENLFLDENILSQYPDIRYSAIDESDITCGLSAAQYDLVRATGFSIQHVSNDMLCGLMNSVKVGGTFILSDASDYGMLYVNSDMEMTSPFWDYGKYISGREDFISYHLPYDVGLVVAKRIA